ncbi:MAG: hypothetical protein HON90_16410 [Halobacteriovoraceae bacterium]|jgi:biopolymer transport protein ExbD|nr:hypothetical protein [Halobacteriovoraceae bacterium]
MGYKTPTRRKAKANLKKINLIPILDAVFIFIFFLLMSTQFVKIFEIGSVVPILSNSPPPKVKKKPLGLTITIKKNALIVSHAKPRQISKRINKNSDGQYNLSALHDYLVGLKKKYRAEELVILEPKVDLKYEVIIHIMDSIRMMNKTDDPLFKKDVDGVDTQIKTLFSKIIFGNLMS